MLALKKDQPSLRILPRDALAMELQEFALDRQARNLTPKTLQWYGQSLDVFTAFCRERALATLGDLTPSHLRLFLVRLQEDGHNPGGVRNIYGAVKALVNWYAAEHDGWPNPLKRVANPKTPQELQDPLDLGDLSKMLATCKKRAFTGDRDRAMLMFLLDSGVRHAEMCALTLDDVNMATGAVLVRCGKGRKPRVAVVGTKCRRALMAYLKHRGDAPGPLWQTQAGGGLSYSGLREVVRRRAKAAGVQEPSLHSFRRAFALACLRNGVNVYALQRMMGHADLSVLRRYLAQTEGDLLAAHAAGGPVDNLL